MSSFQERDSLPIRRRKSVQSLAASAKEPPVHFHALRIPDDQLTNIGNKAVRKFYEVILVIKLYDETLIFIASK